MGGGCVCVVFSNERSEEPRLRLGPAFYRDGGSYLLRLGLILGQGAGRQCGSEPSPGYLALNA